MPRALLSAANAEDLKFTLTTWNFLDHPDHAASIQAYARQAGIDMSIEVMDGGRYYDAEPPGADYATTTPWLWRPDLILVAGLALFGLPFAVNSSLHSYLILAYAGSDRAAEDVGFYYAANAAGRLGGILLSGLLYQWGGIVACLAGSAVMLIVSWLITFLLPVAPTVQTQQRTA